jgi:hypothetical protein
MHASAEQQCLKDCELGLGQLLPEGIVLKGSLQEAITGPHQRDKQPQRSPLSCIYLVEI